MFGVSHGALQFMAYEELKKLYNQSRKVPLDTKFVSTCMMTFIVLASNVSQIVRRSVQSTLLYDH